MKEEDAMLKRPKKKSILSMNPKKCEIQMSIAQMPQDKSYR